VTTVGSGFGIGNAIVEALPRDPGSIPRRTRTREDGSYLIAGIETGAYTLRVDAREQGFASPATGALEIEVAPNLVRGVTDFALDEGAVVTGTVTDGADRPVAGAMVTVTPEQMLQTGVSSEGATEAPAKPLLEALTGKDGRYTLGGLVYDRPYRLRVRAPGHDDDGGTAVRIPPGGSPRSMDVRLAPAQSVRGEVLDADSQPVAGHPVRLLPSPGAVVRGQALAPLETVTGEDGGFVFENLGPGEYLVQSGTEEPYAPPADSDRCIVFTVGDEPVGPLVLVCPPPAEPGGETALQGQVLRPDSLPAPGVQLTAVRPGDPDTVAGVTDEEGRFRLGVVPGSVHDLYARGPAGVGELHDVAAGQEVTLRLEPPARISGLVTDARGGPIEGCTITLRPWGTGGTARPEDLMIRSHADLAAEAGLTDSAGRFEIGGVIPGVYGVRAASPAGESGETEPFPVAAGQDIDGILVEVTPAIVFSGVVRDTRGRPVAEALVKLVRGADGQVEGFMDSLLPAGTRRAEADATTDRHGHFQMDEVHPGKYRVIVTHARHAPHQSPEPLVVRAGESLPEHEVTLARGGEVRGVYTDAGTPREGVLIQLVGPGGSKSATTGPDGSFRIGAVSEGAYLVHVNDPDKARAQTGVSGMSSRPVVVDVSEGETTTVLLPGEGGTTVSGMVSGIPGDRVALVALQRPGAPDAAATDPTDIAATVEAARYLAGQALAGPDGAFRLEQVPPGPHVIEVYLIAIDPARPDLNALLATDRTPKIRQGVEVGEEPMQIQLALPSAENAKAP
jgi:protocatechuate 3,4-dioxygenase beta subunit